MATGTKKQHFVPQLLLRQFASKRERLYCYDMSRDRSFPISVSDAGHQNHFLSIPELDGDRGPGAHFEQLFQSYEGPAISAIRSVQAALAAGMIKAIGDPDRHALARFIAVQFLRTPAAREQTLQSAELMKRTLATEIARRNDIDVNDPTIAAVIDQFSTIPKEQQAQTHGEALLQPSFIEELATKLESHVWLLGLNRTRSPLYVADHPVSLHAHVERPGRGLGIASFGAEVTLPLSSTLQLSLFERRFIQELDGVEGQDGCIYLSLSGENVLHQRSLQVRAARQFLYCETDDFGDARDICNAHPELRDPQRPRLEAWAFGKHELPRRRV